MADFITSDTKNRNAGFSKELNRHSTRVDLTPMVDLGFLLITFFVFTTSMAQPKAMNITEPKDGDPTLVRQSGAMTIMSGEDHRIYYYYKILKDKTELKSTDLKGIRSLILQKKRETELKDLMFIMKSGDNSTFGDNINLLDEMAICNIPAGHYAEVAITQTESDMIGSRK